MAPIAASRAATAASSSLVQSRKDYNPKTTPAVSSSSAAAAGLGSCSFFQSPHQLGKALLEECKIVEEDAEDLCFSMDNADRCASAGRWGRKRRT